jgi:hypothetical protein
MMSVKAWGNNELNAMGISQDFAEQGSAKSGGSE